jgi:hypothetical protein
MCCNYKDKDDFAQDFKNKSIIDPAKEKEAKNQEILDKYKGKDKQVVKMQACMRGYLVRKIAKKAND